MLFLMYQSKELMKCVMNIESLANSLREWKEKDHLLTRIINYHKSGVRQEVSYL